MLTDFSTKMQISEITRSGRACRALSINAAFFNTFNRTKKVKHDEEFPLNDEVLGEVAIAEVTNERWVIKFDSSSIANLGGAGVILYHEGEGTVVLSFKL